MAQTQNESVIREAQRILVRLSRITNMIRPVTVDGIFGPQTEEQIRAFQSFAGLPITGILDEATYKRLVDADRAVDVITGKSVPIYPFERRLSNKRVKKGETFDLVTIIQIMLQALSVASDEFVNVKITGTYDDETERAIKKLQQINNLPQTGEIDLLTWNRLALLYNKYIDSEGE